MSPGWNTYIAVADIEQAVARVLAAGGSIVDPPSDAGRGWKERVLPRQRGRAVPLVASEAATGRAGGQYSRRLELQ